MKPPPKPQPPKTSWWTVPRDQFQEALRAELPRMMRTPEAMVMPTAAHGIEDEA
jgi:hypothetical protein